MRKTFTHLSILLILLLSCCPTKTEATVRDKHAINPSVPPQMAGMDSDMLPPLPHRVRKTSSSVDSTYTWTSLGTGQYREDLMTTFYSVDNEVYEVEIQEADQQPGLYRLVYPYGEAYPYNEDYGDGTADWDLTTTYYMVIDASDPDYVWVHEDYQGLDWGYGNILIMSYIAYYINYGGYELDYLKEAVPSYFGTLEDGIITMPTNTMLINMSGYSSSIYYANKNGKFAVALPGYVIRDYEVSFTYSGAITDSDSVAHAAGAFEFGEDVAYIRYALTTEEDSTDALLEAIESGAADYATLTDDTEQVWLDVEGTGSYYLVYVIYNASDEVVGSGVEEFYYRAPMSSSWMALYDGVYDYEAYDLYGYGGMASGTAEATLYQGADNPTDFCVRPWWSAEDGLCFRIDDDNSLFIEPNWTGQEYGSYGDLYASGLSYYFGDGYSDGYYDPDTGVYMFYLVYYVNAGWFTAIGESFTVSDPSAIEGTSSETLSADCPVAFYSLSGQRLDKPASGQVNLIRMSDGSVRKVLVK